MEGLQTSPVRVQYANGVRRRTELADAALEVVAMQGFQQLSMRQLASEIGTSHTMIRHHFGSKEGLLKVVLARREAREEPWREELLEEFGPLDGLPMILAHNQEIRELIRLDATLALEAVSPDHPAHEYMVGAAQRFLESVKDGLQGERDAGRLRPGLDLDLVAQQIRAFVHGLQRDWLQDPKIDMPAIAQSYSALLRA